LASERASKGHHLEDSMFKILPEELKQSYIRTRLIKGNPLSVAMLRYGGEAVTDKYLNNEVKGVFKAYGGGLQQNSGVNRNEYPAWFEKLPDELRIRSLNKILDFAIENDIEDDLKYIQIDDRYYRHLGPNKKMWLKIQVDRGHFLGEAPFQDLSDDQKRAYAEMKYGDSGWVPHYIRPYLKNSENYL